MSNFSLTLILLCALSLLGGCMPGAAPGANSKQMASNEKKLRDSGIVALEPGSRAPSFSASGTGGVQFSIGQSAASQSATPGTLPDPALEVEADTAADTTPGTAADPAASTAADTGTDSTADSSADTATDPAAEPGTDAAGEELPLGQPDAPADGEAEAQAPAYSDLAADSGAGLENPVVLLFFPAVHTPNSAKQLVSFGKEAERLKSLGLQVFGVNTASVSELEKFAVEYGITVPLLSDPDASISVAYGCLAEGGRFPQRTAVGIATDGSISFFKRGLITPQMVLQELKLDAKPAK
ncbi:redoxin domain-containing protein [bacterium]|nr:redoxin domain-containing protein [bacterium]